VESLKKVKKAIRRIIGRLSVIKVIILLIAVVAFFSAIAMTVTSQTGFCNSCHIMNDYYASWEKSSHHDVSCLSCHLQPGFGGYIKGKINGLAQAVDCAVGRVGTKAEATVLDQSCLRSACHSTEALLEKDLLFEGVKFTHKGHIQETMDGINVTCGTCHNHYQGDEHFSVEKEICFSCHFIKSDKGGSGIVKSECLDCHNVPQKVIERGLVKVDHQEFVSYKASCEDSCHKRQVEHVSEVSDMICVNCHSFGMDEGLTSEELHAYHTGHEKVECLSCHGNVIHGPDKASSVASMIDCQNCHSDTHGIQQTIFTADHSPVHTQSNEKILSPMFLTHVECTGCHIETTTSAGHTLNSLGTVARAVPEACDNCHEPGTGDRYIPFWQKRIKELHAQAHVRIRQKEDSSLTANAGKEIAKAKEILDSIEADGSWGVHNLKYTEALLRQVNEIINQAE
jgi:nitrate/TMAO reductase-like tetraheme cytochrome c subunit